MRLAGLRLNRGTDQVRSEALKASSPARLGAVEGGICVPQQRIGIQLIPESSDDAHTGGDGHLAARKSDGGGEGFHDACRNHLGNIGIAELGEQHDELVATHSYHGVACADGGLKTSRGDAENLVAGVMSEGIVDVFESVQVEHQQRESLLVAFCAFQCAEQSILEDHAGCQSGEGIVERHVAKAFFAFAKEICLLLQAPSQDNHPNQNGQCPCEHGGQEDERMSRRPPGRAMQDGDVARRAQQNAKRFGYRNTFPHIALRIEVDGTDAGDSKFTSDPPWTRLGSSDSLGQDRREECFSGG